MLPSTMYRTSAVLFCAAALVFAVDCTTRGKSQENAPARPVAPAPPPTPKPAAAPPAPAPGSLATEDERNTVSVFQRNAPATVFVTQKRVLRDFFGARAEIPAGAGSGFIWDRQGHVVTNFHVILQAQAVTVTLRDHKSYDATVVGTEPRKDIAVLKIQSPPGDLVPVRLRQSKLPLQVGQKTLAIGNPFGLDHTLTTGIVSALGREVEGIGGVTIRDMIQTDAAINPGNSGGPLLDSNGDLIGMNTMIFSRSGASAGIGFAVPASFIERIVPQIIKTGKAEQVGLGINIDPSRRLERSAGIRGVIVLGVSPDSPAGKAGLRGVTQTNNGIQLGDVIVGIDNDRVDDYDDLYNALDKHEPGDVVDVTVVREGQKARLRTQLIVLP
ncbi:MAG: trypsin-like peptidase domain-containing protein [Deltaproteobacteria bacterium]|nr:trypsin-like peptidase domain-containing protein [Deltaproteobacteria bacterium]